MQSIRILELLLQNFSCMIKVIVIYSFIKRHLLIAKERHAMFRLWGKLFKDNRMLKDTVIENNSTDTRTHKIFQGLDDICYQFDLGKPIWLNSNVTEFKRHRKTRFTSDNFVESIDFDFLEIHIIDED